MNTHKGLAHGLSVVFIIYGLALMLVAVTVQTAFALPLAYTLSAVVSPTGAGSVTPSSGTYYRNSTVRMAAVPKACYAFDHWEGSLSGKTNPASYRFSSSNSKVTITAVFKSTCASQPPSPPSVSSHFEVVGYFTEWGVYDQPYYVKNIVTSGSADKLTVLNYAFGIPNLNSTGVVACQIHDPYAAYQQTYSTSQSVDGVADVSNQPLRGNFNQLKKLKAMYPNLKIVISIGGWSGSMYFSDAALTAASRSAFVKSCIDLFINGNLPVQNGAGGTGVAAGIFDGIDLDWEFPVSDGATGTHHNVNDASNYTLLLAEFRKQFGALGRADLLLTMAAPGSEYDAQNFQMSAYHHYLDYVEVMTYDFHGDWNTATGHHANLCTSSSDPASASARSVDKTVKLYRDKYGVPSSKILPGAAFYGNGWSQVGGTNNGLYQSAGGSAAGKYEQGSEYYRDLVPKLSSGFVQYWDNLSKAAWMYSIRDHTFWTYDEPKSLALKAQYIKNYSLGGITFWDISGDDDQGQLVSTLYNGLQPTAAASDPCAGN